MIDIDLDTLMEQASAEPQLAAEKAHDLLDAASPEQRVRLLHSLGVARRNLRDPEMSVEVLSAALADARRLELDDNSLWAIRVDLAVSTTDLGDPTSGLGILGDLDGPTDEVLADLEDSTVGRVHHARALVLQRIGSSDEARRCYGLALPIYERIGNQLGLGHVAGNLGILATYEGEVEQALDYFDTAEQSYAAAEQDLWVALTIMNKGWATGCGGNLVRALQLLSEAERRLARLDVPDGLRVVSKGEVLLRAGLYSSARTELLTAVEDFERRGLAIDRSETLILAAQAAELDGDIDNALQLSRAALSELDEQARQGWTAAARAISFGLECRAGAVAGDVAATARHLGADLSAAGHDALIPSVQLSAAWALLDQADLDGAERAIAEAEARSTRSEERSLLALTQARLQQLLGRPTEALGSLEEGYRRLESDLQLLGGVDIAALAATSLARIVAEAKSILAPTDRSDEFMRWADRGRQIATWRWPRVIDPELTKLLNRLRALNSTSGALDSDTAEEIADLRSRIQDLRWQLERSNPTPDALPSTTPPAGTDDDGASMLVDLSQAGGRWYITTAVDQTSARRPAVLHKSADLDPAGLAAAVRLGRVFQTSPPAIQVQLMDQLEQVLAPLDAVVTEHLPQDPDAAVLISIDEDLADLPWSALPCLWERPYSILPTHRYLADRPDRVSTIPGVSMMVGPGLASGGAETSLSAGRLADQITVADIDHFDQLAAALDRHIVHIAAHGGPEPDNPLFNWLEFDCGRVFLHDLMFLDAVPEIIVLAACYAGQSQRIGAGGTASFANGFLGVGSRWVVSACTALTDDQALVEFASSVLESIVDGMEPPHALAHARRATGDRRSHPAAIAFACFGG